MEKMTIIEKMTSKSQASESSSHNDNNFSNTTMEMMEVIYHCISFYIVFLSFS